MARQDGTTASGRQRTRGVKHRYFYLNGDLHKSLHIDRTNDTIMAWSYPLAKRVGYTYSDVLKRRERAFTTQEAAKMVGRARYTLEAALLRGEFPPPQYTYGLTELRQKFQYLWHEKDIVNAWQYFASVHRGQPRKDGRITPQAMPTLREVKAMIRQDDILYVKVGDEYRPVWQAKDF